MTLYGGPDQFVRRLNLLHDVNITGKRSWSSTNPSLPCFA